MGEITIRQPQQSFGTVLLWRGAILPPGARFSRRSCLAHGSGQFDSGRLAPGLRVLSVSLWQPNSNSNSIVQLRRRGSEESDLGGSSRPVSIALTNSCL